MWLSLLSLPCPLERGVALSIEPAMPIGKGCDFVYSASHAHFKGVWLCPLSLPSPFAWGVALSIEPAMPI